MLTEVGMTLLLVGLFAGGIYGSRTFLAGKKDIARPAATQMVSNDQNAAKPALVEKPGPDTINTVGADSIRQAATAAMTAFKKPVRKATDSQTVANTRPADLVEPLTPLEKEEAKTEPPIVKEEILKKEKTEPAQENGENKEVQKADDSEKKKGFLKKLFGKKKKDDERSGKDNNEN